MIQLIFNSPLRSIILQAPYNYGQTRKSVLCSANSAEHNIIPKVYKIINDNGIKTLFEKEWTNNWDLSYHPWIKKEGVKTVKLKMNMELLLFYIHTLFVFYPELLYELFVI